MQRFLQFRPGCHGLPIATGRLAGAGHVDRANRVCLACSVRVYRPGSFKATADLFTPHTDTMCFFAQQDHLGVLNYVIDCLNCMHI